MSVSAKVNGREPKSLNDNDLDRYSLLCKLVYSLSN